MQLVELNERDDCLQPTKLRNAHTQIFNTISSKTINVEKVKTVECNQYLLLITSRTFNDTLTIATTILETFNGEE